MILQTQKMANGGQAIARHSDGRIVFVNGALPFETVDVEVISEKKDYLTAQLVKVIEPSLDRVEPSCPYWGKCGGCSLMQMSSASQTKCKHTLLEEAVSRVNPNAKFLESATSSPFNYRTRVRFQSQNGNLGFLGEKSNRFVPVSNCPVLTESFNAFLASHPNFPDGEVNCLLTDDGVAFDTQAHPVSLLGKTLFVKTTSFFQSNLGLLPQMISHVVALTEGENVMDLYSGVGTFSAFLEDHHNVTAVESDKKCLALAKMFLKKTRFFTAEVEKWNTSKPVDTVIVDPPRTGLDAKVPYLISKWGAKRIIYVSCFLPTLGRDLARLSSLGYNVQNARLFDFYPQTPHSEAVVLLTKEEKTKEN